LSRKEQLWKLVHSTEGLSAGSLEGGDQVRIFLRPRDVGKNPGSGVYPCSGPRKAVFDDNTFGSMGPHGARRQKEEIWGGLSSFYIGRTEARLLEEREEPGEAEGQLDFVVAAT
jgi:hypothetical protein